MGLRLLGTVFLLALFVADAESWGCDIKDVVGIWVLKRDLSTTDDYTYCWRNGYQTLEHRIALTYPDVALDEYGNFGHWTLVYGIGIEITIHGRKYYSYFDWRYNYRSHYWTIDCSKLEIGSSRDVLTNNYACFGGNKAYRLNETEADKSTTVEPIPTLLRDHPNPTDAPKDRKMKPAVREADEPKSTSTPAAPTFLRGNHPNPTDVPTFENRQKIKINHDLIASINNNDLHLWEAGSYDHMLGLTEEDLVMLAGGNMSLRIKPAKPAPVTEEQLLKAKYFPKSFDWRNVEGQNFVSPVRNQGHCGSCYAFAVLGMHESRIRIMTKNTATPVLAPQDIVNCSPYSYGCHGGLVYTEGMYAEEFGFLDEACSIYAADKENCERDLTCQRYYGTDYQYIGGYYGGSNDILMMDAILNNGPIVVVFGVFEDFFYYRRGVYYHSGPDHLYGFHAVTAVGWGQDERSGTRYWIVKNSWGKTWGEEGYFRIVRGRDDSFIESGAFEAYPII